MSSVIGHVTFRCMIICDKCETRFNALDTPNNEEGEISEAILDKKTLNHNVSFEVNCPQCSRSVEIKGIEWY